MAQQNHTWLCADQRPGLNSDVTHDRGQRGTHTHLGPLRADRRRIVSTGIPFSTQTLLFDSRLRSVLNIAHRKQSEPWHLCPKEPPPASLRHPSIHPPLWTPSPLKRSPGGAPPPLDQSDHHGKIQNLPWGRSCQAIFGTQMFGSQTPHPTTHPIPPLSTALGIGTGKWICCVPKATNLDKNGHSTSCPCPHCHLRACLACLALLSLCTNTCTCTNTCSFAFMVQLMGRKEGAAPRSLC